MAKELKDISKSTSKVRNDDIVADQKAVSFALLFVFVLIIIAVGFTYAFFSINYTKLTDDPTTDVETALLDIDFETSDYISNDNAMLINDDEAYKLADRTIFSVSRSEYNTVEYVYYTLSLVELQISPNLDSPYLKWSLYDTDEITEDTTPLSSGTFENIVDNKIDLYNQKIPLAKGIIDNFVLLIWLSNDDDKNQIELLNGTFGAKVQVSAVNTNG